MQAISAKSRAFVASDASSRTLPSPSPFNARGVVAEPKFQLSRPTEPGARIEFSVGAHPLPDGSWIAEPTWMLMTGSIPCDATPLSDRSKPFPTRSEAVEAAFDKGMRQVMAQRHRESTSPEWSEEVDSLRAWMAFEMDKVRLGDEGLPLRGVTAIDVFSGVGGFSMALASLGASIELAIEIDPEARKTYGRNLRPKAVQSDICDVDASKLKADIVAMGLLCQAFFPAGDGRGFAEPRLAAAYARAMRFLEQVDAKAVVVECARQFMTSNGGKDSRTLIQTLLRAGYRVQHRALNAAGFGVPQSRERSFIVATRIGANVDQVAGVLFPEERAPTAAVEDILHPGLPATILDREIDFGDASPLERAGHIAKIGQVKGKRGQGYRVYSPKGVGVTLTASGGGRAQYSGAYAVPGGARALSPREAYRMQGMPERAQTHPTPGLAMKQAGNAVAIPLARELFRGLAPALATR